MMTLLSLLPIVSLLLCLIVFKFSVARSGAISLVIALVIALAAFRLPITDGLPIAVGKALWLALFVSLIVWFAMFLYHLVSDFKAIDVINKNLSIFIKDKFVAFLLLAWMFTGLLQGMAGFGVPAVIVTPILIALGFNKVKSLSAALLGHSWAVTFGSLGAAFFVIYGLTETIYQTDLARAMFIFNTAAHFLTGIGVCLIYDGWKGVKKGFLYVLPVSLVMTGVQFLTIFVMGAYPIAGLLPALIGLITLFLLYKLRSGKGTADETETTEEPAEEGQPAKKGGLYKGDVNLLQAALPYLVIIVLALSFQLVMHFAPAAHEATSFGPNFGGFETNRAYPDTHVVAPVTNFNPISVFRHPAMLLLAASVTALLVYKSAGIWSGAVFKGAVQKTVKKGIPATLALLALGNMSLIMMESGMTDQLAYATANLAGGVYPLFAPFIGVLGSFLTGNNTNANVLFGGFQYTIALTLNLNPAVMAAVQSMTAGVAVSVGPTLILMGALASDQKGVESVILKKLLPIVLVIAAVMGIVNMIAMRVIPV